MAVDHKQIHERPMDPTRNASDFIGDVTGHTGLTTGSAQKTSAEPDDKNTDTENLPGGIIEGQTKTGSGINNDMTDDKAFAENNLKTMSSDRAEMNKELGSEPSKNPADDSDTPKMVTHQNDPSMSNNEDGINTNKASNMQPSNQGEQSVSGTTPAPDSDDDTLENAHRMGQQLEEQDDMEHPKELNIASDIDKAEEAIRTH